MALVFFCRVSYADAQTGRFKALFIYNFTRYLEWPAERGGGDFRIAVLGDSPVRTELEQIAAKKRVKNRPIVIVHARQVADIRDAHMVYVPPSSTTRLARVLASVMASGTVVISDCENGIAQGAALNLCEQNGRQTFEISPAELKKQNVKVRGELLQLGIAR